MESVAAQPGIVIRPSTDADVAAMIASGALSAMVSAYCCTKGSSMPTCST